MAVNTNRFLPSSRGGALATTRPTATLCSLQETCWRGTCKAQPDDEGDTKPSLEEDVAAIRKSLRRLRRFLVKLLKLNKDTMRFEARMSRRILVRRVKKKRREKNEKNGFGIKMPKGLKIPKSGFLDNIRNFLGTVIMGRFLVLLVQYAPRIAEFIKFISPVATFIGDVVADLLIELGQRLHLDIK